MSPHCKEHQSKKMCVDRNLLNSVHFMLNVTKNLTKSINIKKRDVSTAMNL